VGIVLFVGSMACSLQEYFLVIAGVAWVYGAK